MKEGQHRKNWKRRFFLLDKGLLTYYEKEEKKGSNKGENELGRLFLKNYTIVRPHPDQILLQSTTDEKARKLLLECSDQVCQKAWIAAITDHINYVNAANVSAP